MKHVIDPNFTGLVFSDAGEIISRQVFGPRISGTSQTVTAADDLNAITANLVYGSHPERALTVRAGDSSVVVNQDALGYILTAPGGGTLNPDDANLQIASQVYQVHQPAISTIRAGDASLIVTQDALGYSLVVTTPVVIDDASSLLASQVYQAPRPTIPTIRAGDGSLTIVQDALGYSLVVTTPVVTDSASSILASQAYGSPRTSGVLGTGLAPRIAEWASTNILKASTIAKTGAGVFTLNAGADFTLTITGTSSISGTNTGDKPIGGVDTQVQFNDGGNFGGDNTFTWDKVNNILQIDTLHTVNAIASNYGGTGVNNSGRTLTISSNSGTLNFLFASETLSIGSNFGLNYLIAGVPSFTVDDSSGTHVLLILQAPSTSFGYISIVYGKTLTVTDTANVSGTNTGDQFAAGGDTYIQFNDGGTAFGGDSEFTWNKTANVLKVGTTGLVSFGGNLQLVGPFSEPASGGGINSILNVFSSSVGAIDKGGTIGIGGGTGNAVDPYVFGSIKAAKQTAAGDNNYGGYLALYTTDSGGSPANRLNINSTGIVSVSSVTDSSSSTTGALIVGGGVGIAKTLNVGTNLGVGAAAVSNYGAIIWNTVTSGDGRGVYSASFANAAATSTTGLYVIAGTGLAASFTLGTALGVHIIDANKAAGTTITTQVGLKIDPMTTGATNYAIQADAGISTFADTTDSTSTATGAIVVSGGIGIAKQVTVGTLLGVGRAPTLSIAPIDAAQSNSGATTYISVANTAAVSTSNNAGILFRVNSSTQERTALQIQASLSTTTDATRGSSVAFSTNSAGTLAVSLTIDSSRKVIAAGQLSTTDTTDSSSTTTGSLVAAGGAGIAKNLYVGTNVYANRLVANSDQSANSGASLTFVGAVAGGNLYGSINLALVNGTTAGATAGYYAVNTSAAAFTLTSAVVLRATSVIKGAGSTITTVYGLLIDAQTVGGTNYAIFAGAGLSSFGDTTDSTSTTTGAITTAGGVGIAKAVTIGTYLGVGAGPSSGSGLTVAHASNAATFVINDAGTNNAPTIMNYVHNTSGTPTFGFGIQIAYSVQTTTTPSALVALDQSYWTDATHASRTSIRLWFAQDSGGLREIFRARANGSVGQIGFLGADAASRQVLGAAAPAGGTGATAGAYDTAAHRDAAITLLNNIRTALINLGLCST